MSDDATRGRLFGALRKIAEDTRSFEPPYIPSRFLQDLANSDPVELVTRYVTSRNPSDGFVRLWSEGRLDLSVEHVAWRFRDLLPPHVSEAAVARLEAMGFDPRRHG